MNLYSVDFKHEARKFVVVVKATSVADAIEKTCAWAQGRYDFDYGVIPNEDDVQEITFRYGDVAIAYAESR